MCHPIHQVAQGEWRTEIPRHVLFGNGLIIQFGGERYTNSGIIRRALENINSGSFPKHLYPPECAELVRVLHREYRSVLNGAYDQFAFASFERAALEDFKHRYSSKRRCSVDEIGFEDYFLLFELVHNKLRVNNPERFHVRGVFKRMFLDAVFDGGAIQTLHERFPSALADWIGERDLVLTTNYDSNLESLTLGEVVHLHGAFDILSDVYDPSSFRNQLSEDLLDGEVVDERYPHLYSSCLFSFVSELKSYAMSEASLANSAMEKFSKAYDDDPSIRSQIDDWDENVPLLRRLREAIKLKCDRPELQHSQQYPHDRLSEISGKLDVVGLSPNNDNHVFAKIIGNSAISSIAYYCYERAEAEDAAMRLEGKDVSIRDVQDLWIRLR